MTRKLILFTSIFLLSAPFVRSQWVTQWHGFDTAASVDHISAVNANIAWASVTLNNFPMTDTLQHFTRTTDAGNTWQTGVIHGSSGMREEMIFALDAQVAWVLLDSPSDTGGKILKTTDGGNNWQVQPSAVFHVNPKIIHFWTADSGVCIGDAHDQVPDPKFEIYTTFDAGASWHIVADSNMPVSDKYEITAHNSYYVKGNTMWFGGSTNGRIFVSYDKGYHWSFKPFPANYVSKVFFRDTMALAGYYEPALEKWILYTSGDSGQHWQSRPYYGNAFDQDICMVPGTSSTFISCGLKQGFNSGISVSNDWGFTWTDMPQPPSSSIIYNHLAFLDPLTGWAGGRTESGSQHSGIYKYTGSALIANNFNEISPELNVFPNPASNFVQVKLSHFTDQEATIVLFDITGKEISTSMASQNGGSLALQIPLDGVSRGIYIVKITSAHLSLQKKLILN